MPRASSCDRLLRCVASVFLLFSLALSSGDETPGYALAFNANVFSFYCGEGLTCTFVYSSHVTTAYAERECRTAHGGWLASITDLTQNNIICNTVSKYTSNIGVLIGAQYVTPSSGASSSSGGSWQWIAGPHANTSFASSTACSTQQFCNVPNGFFTNGYQSTELYMPLATCDWRKLVTYVNGFVCMKQSTFACSSDSTLLPQRLGCLCVFTACGNSSSCCGGVLAAIVISVLLFCLLIVCCCRRWCGCCKKRNVDYDSDAALIRDDEPDDYPIYRPGTNVVAQINAGGRQSPFPAVVDGSGVVGVPVAYGATTVPVVGYHPAYSGDTTTAVVPAKSV